MNIPKYRAIKIDSEEYVIGALSPCGKFIITYLEIDNSNKFNYIDDIVLKEIDISTLAIHFNDMFDSENNPIFASLSKDGKGGDKYINSDVKEDVFIFYSTGVLPYFESYESFKVIGIQK